MKLDDILLAWKEDAEIDSTELAQESVKIPLLHHKYMKMLMEEVLLLKKLTVDYKKLYRIKWEYYNGLLTDKQLKERGWEPILMKILKTEISIYLDSDDELTDIKLRMDYQEQKVKALEDIIKTIGNRNFTIKNSIDFMKFQHGQ